MPRTLVTAGTAVALSAAVLFAGSGALSGPVEEPQFAMSSMRSLDRSTGPCLCPICTRVIGTATPEGVVHLSPSGPSATV